MTLAKIETAGDVPSVDHSELQMIKKRYKFLTQDRLTRAIEKRKKEKQKEKLSPAKRSPTVSVAASAAKTTKKEGGSERITVELACIKRKNEALFFVEANDGPFPAPDVPNFGNNVVWAINYLHSKGYSYVDDEKEQDNWKKIFNITRDDKNVNLTERAEEPRTVGVFSKEVSASENNSHRPILLAIFQEPRNSDTVNTHKKGMFYLQGSDGESSGGPHDAVTKAIKEARALGYEKMNAKGEERWSNMITKFINEDILFDFYIPEEYERGMFDQVVGVFEKKM